MDRMTSTEFRKHYARLTGPTEVTAGGRVIGVWTPAVVTIPQTAPKDPSMTEPGWVRTFTPAPKPGKAGRK
jgi:hypothetical protein